VFACCTSDRTRTTCRRLLIAVWRVPSRDWRKAGQGRRPTVGGQDKRRGTAAARAPCFARRTRSAGRLGQVPHDCEGFAISMATTAPSLSISDKNDDLSVRLGRKREAAWRASCSAFVRLDERLLGATRRAISLPKRVVRKEVSRLHSRTFGEPWPGGGEPRDTSWSARCTRAASGSAPRMRRPVRGRARQFVSLRARTKTRPPPPIAGPGYGRLGGGDANGPLASS